MPHLQTFFRAPEDGGNATVIASRCAVDVTDSTMSLSARELARSPYSSVSERVAHLFEAGCAGMHSAEEGLALATCARRGVAYENRAAALPISVVTADHQKQGTGRVGRLWRSAAGKSFAGTFAAALPNRIVEALGSGWLTSAAGLTALAAVREAVNRVQPLAEGCCSIGMRWPNDLFAGGRKLGGILTRVIARDADDAAILFGIGMNLNMSETELPLPEATSLKIVAGTALPPYTTLRDWLVERIARGMNEWFGRALTDVTETKHQLREEVMRATVTVGTRARARLITGETLTGIAEGIDEDAALLLRLDSQELRRITNGDVGMETAA